MSNDLTTFKARTTSQDRITDHREGIIDSRRDTRAPQFQGSADMRSAARGDGGAQQLMQTLGLVNNAAQNFQNYADNKFAKQEVENSAQGATDVIANHVDDRLMKKSLGYREAVTLGRTSTAWGADKLKFDQEFAGFIEHQDDPDLNVRRQQALDKIDEFYRNFAIDPNTGQPKEFLGTPAAKRWLAGEMAKTREIAMTNATNRIEERFNGEAVGHATQALRDQALSGSGVDMGTIMKMIPDTVPQDTVRKAFLTTGMELATELSKTPGREADGRRILNQILGPTPVDPAKPGITEVDPNTGLVAPTAPQAAPVGKGGPTNRVAFDTLAAAVMGRESGGNAKAVSPKGAVGTMQTMPFTLTDPGFGVKPAANNSPAELERVGKDYLRAMLRKYSGNVPMALAAYNAGPGTVDDWVNGTNHTGKNPTHLQLADPRKGGTASFVASIPFKETKDYVAAISGRVGLGGGEGSTRGPSDPITPNPDFVMDPEPLDPIAEADRNAGPTLFPPMTGKFELRPEERIQLVQLRDQLANDVRNDLQRKQAKDQDEATGNFILRLNGQGAPVTPTEIAEAARSRTISQQQAGSLFNLIRSNQNEAENEVDRQTARADRREARSQEQQADAITANYTASVLGGKETAQQARARALREVQDITDPKVKRMVLNNVQSLTGDVENLRNNSEPVRNAMGQLDELEANISGRIDKLPASRKAHVGSAMRTQLDLTKSRVARRIQNNEDPSKVVTEEMTRLGGIWGTLTAPPKPQPGK